MTTTTLLKQIKSLPTAQRLTIIEKTLEMIEGTSHYSEKKKQLAKAARLLKKNYLNDKELTAFTALDSEDFDEAR